MNPTGRFIAFDRIRLSKSKIKADDENELIVNVVLASEIVHRYGDGMAYKSADELEKAAWTAEGMIQRIKVTDVAEIPEDDLGSRCGPRLINAFRELHTLTKETTHQKGGD